MMKERFMFRRAGILLSAVLWYGGLYADEGLDSPQLTVATRRFGGSDLISVDVTSKEVIRLTQDIGQVNEPCWHPDGGRLLLVVTTNRAGALKLFDVKSANLTAIGNGPNDRGPCWSPDGQKILFAGDTASGADLFVAGADGANVQNLTNNPAWDSDGAWSPDGRKIAFTSNRTGRFRLYVMNHDGTDITDLLKQDLVHSIYPCWSPDGEQIAFGGAGGDGTIQLCVVNSDGQGLQQLSEGGQLNSHAAWSSDGQYIAYARFNTMRTGDNSLGKGDLMVYDCIAATHSKLLSDELPIVGPRPSWKPANKSP
jgi:Tol biopolymer transport system component